MPQSGRPLEGRVAVVTGGSRGIGRSIALALGARGASVAFNFLENASAASEVASALAREGRCLSAPCDVRDERQVSEFFARVEGEMGPVSILVNNAGVSRDGLFVFMDAARWKDVLSVTLDGAFHCIRQVARGMMLRRWGRIINIVSPSGMAGNAGQANYATAKAGLVGLTRSLARELGPQGVLVNAVSPGLIDTDMTRAMNEREREKILALVSLRRMGTAEEVASLVAFLGSDEASYITGQIITVDGGLS